MAKRHLQPRFARMTTWVCCLGVLPPYGSPPVMRISAGMVPRDVKGVENVSLDWHQFASPSGILDGFEAAVTFVSLKPLVLLDCHGGVLGIPFEELTFRPFSTRPRNPEIGNPSVSAKRQLT